MLLTKASEYALMSLSLIVHSDKPLDVTKLSTELNIPKSFLAKILQSLAKDGILTSHKGVNGGFSLSKSIDQITILDIIKAVEDKPASVFECSGGINDCPGNRATTCQIWPFLHVLQGKIDTFLTGITLEELWGCKKIDG